MNLYEIEFYIVAKVHSIYQIPSDNEYNALVRLGQIFNNEEYEIRVLRVHKV